MFLKEIARLKALQSAGALEQARYFILAGLEKRSLPIHLFKAAYYGSKVINFSTANLLAIPTPCTDQEFEIVLNLYQSAKVFAPMYALINILTHNVLEHLLKFILYPSKGTVIDFDQFSLIDDTSVESVIKCLARLYSKFITGCPAEHMLACSTQSDLPPITGLSMPVVCPSALVLSLRVYYVKLQGPHRFLATLGQSYQHMIVVVNHYALELVVDKNGILSRNICFVDELPYEEEDYTSEFIMPWNNELYLLQDFFEKEREFSAEFLKDRYDTFYHNCHHYGAGLISLFGKSGRRFAATLPAKPTPFHEDVKNRRRVAPIPLEMYPNFEEELKELQNTPEFRTYWTAKLAKSARHITMQAIYNDEEKFTADISYITNWQPRIKEELISEPVFKNEPVNLLTEAQIEQHWDETIEIYEREDKYETDYNKLLRTVLPDRYVDQLQKAALKRNEGQLLQLFTLIKRTLNGTWRLFQVLNILDQWYKQKGAYYREGKKVVWCLMLPAARRWIINSAERDFSDLLPDKTVYVDIKDPRENMDILAKQVADYFENGKYTQWKDYRRRVNTDPIVDPLLSKWANRWHNMFDFQVGVATNQFVEAQYLTASIARYLKANKYVNYNHEYVDEIATAVVDTFPGSFKNANFVSFYRILNHVNRRLSSTFPFFLDARTKKKKDLFSFYGKKKVNDFLIQYMKEGKIYNHVHHMFFKEEVIPYLKILNKPGAMRTIVAQSLVNYACQGIFSLDIAKRKHYKMSPCAIGLPMTHGFLSMLAKQHSKYKYTFATDFTACDASLPTFIIQCVAEMVKKGYTGHRNYKKIGSWIDATYKALEHGSIFNVHTGDVHYKNCGTSTGNFLTSFNNFMALVACYLVVWKHLTGLPAKAFFEYNELSAMGDDNILSTNIRTSKWNPGEICRAMKELLGIECRVEGDGTIEDCMFLSKKFVKGEKYAHEFMKAGLPVPEYAVVQNFERLFMRLSVPKNRKIANPITAYARAIGYLNMMAHNEEGYNTVLDYIKDILKDHRWITNKGYANYLKKNKVPSYLVVLQRNYQSKEEAAKGILKPYNYTMEDIYDYAYLTLKGVDYSLAQVNALLAGWAGFAMGNGLHDIEESYLNLSVASAYTEDFTIERFIFIMNDRPTTFEAYQVCVNQSPWSTFCRAAEYYRDQSHLDLEVTRNKVMTDMAQLTFAYIMVHRGLIKIDGLPVMGQLLKLFNLHITRGPAVYANANYANWYLTGTSSEMLSSIMPKDGYANHKKAAIRLFNILPRMPILPCEILRQPFNALMQVYLAFVTTKYKATYFISNLANSEDYNLDLDFENPWLKCQKDIESLLSANRELILTSATATGKTTLLPRVLAKKYDRIYIMLPRVILALGLASSLPCSQYINADNPVIKPDTKFIIGTYGYFAERGVVLSPTDLLFCDEFHEADFDMFRVLEENQVCDTIYSSATPNVVGFEHIAKYHSPIKARFDKISVPMSTPDFANEVAFRIQNAGATVQNGKTQPALVLAIHPSKKFCERLVKSLKHKLDRQDIMVVSRDTNPNEIPAGYHMIATSVVDAGINLPGVTYVIDSGLSFQKRDGNLITVVASEATKEQRKGRAGRYGTGYYTICPPPTGTLLPQKKDIDIVKFINYPEISSKYFGVSPDKRLRARTDKRFIPNVYDFSVYAAGSRFSIHMYLACYYASNDDKVAARRAYKDLVAKRNPGRDYNHIQREVGNNVLLEYELMLDIFESNPQLEALEGDFKPWLYVTYQYESVQFII